MELLRPSRQDYMSHNLSPVQIRINANDNMQMNTEPVQLRDIKPSTSVGDLLHSNDALKFGSVFTKKRDTTIPTLVNSPTNSLNSIQNEVLLY